MKSLPEMFSALKPSSARRAILTGATTLAVAALCTSAFLPRAQARDHQGGHEQYNYLDELYDLQQVAELDQLLADFHGALSYGGNITAMMALWTPDSSITFNGTPYVGKAQVRAFFLAQGYFLNHWVSLAPEFKTQITVHGDKAQATTQCVATDISVTPAVVKGVVEVNATMEKREGKWYFTSMNNTSGATL